MPTSPYQFISPIMAEVVRVQPKSVLDLGCGYGKYGALISEYSPCDFVIGYEVWDGYDNPMQETYKDIYSSDYANAGGWRCYKDYDLVLWIDGPEHVEKNEALRLLTHLREHNKAVIVSVPLGYREQGAVGGNEYERHLSTWNASDFPGSRVVYQDKRGVVMIYE